jgi:hypothetical protein
MSLFDLFRRKKEQSPFAPLPEDHPAQLSGFSGTPQEYFSGIFAAAFPGFELEENVSVKTLFGDTPDSRGCRPISILLRRNGDPALAVILCPSAEGELPDVLNTISLCQTRNLTCHRYYTELRNRSAFVVERSREVLEAILQK